MAKVIRYSISQESGCRKIPSFDRVVRSVLGNPKKTWRGYTFIHDQNSPEFQIILTTPKTVFNKCRFKGLSCADVNLKIVYINRNRYLRGAVKSKLSLSDYRVYVINHEVGHIIGKGHVKCPCTGKCNKKVPVMNQATKGIGHCRPNNMPLKYE